MPRTWSLALARRLIGAGLVRTPDREQLIHQLCVLVIDRPVQRRRAIHLRGVDVRLSGNQRADRGQVVFLGGIGDIAAAGRGNGTRQGDCKKNNKNGRESCAHNQKIVPDGLPPVNHFRAPEPPRSGRMLLFLFR